VNRSFLLDTNAAIALLNGDLMIVEALQKAEIFFSVIGVGELYFGAEKSARRDTNRASLERLLQGRKVLGCDLAVAQEYGRLKAALRRQGTPLPENDIWIAAIALRNKLVLMTRDKHFRHITNLSSGTW
jgi:tRNA(fMet)-specific endonuclease VapC